MHDVLLETENFEFIMFSEFFGEFDFTPRVVSTE